MQFNIAFLKPTRSRLLLSTLFFIVFYILGGWLLNYCFGFQTDSISISPTDSSNNLIIYKEALCKLIGFPIGIVYFYISKINILLFFIILFIILYIFICIIIVFYKKIKKIKNNS